MPGKFIYCFTYLHNTFIEKSFCCATKSNLLATKSKMSKQWGQSPLQRYSKWALFVAVFIRWQGGITRAVKGETCRHCLFISSFTVLPDLNVCKSTSEHFQWSRILILPWWPILHRRLFRSVVSGSRLILLTVSSMGTYSGPNEGLCDRKKKKFILIWTLTRNSSL